VLFRSFGINAGDWQSDKEWHFAGPRMPLSGAGEDSVDSDEQQINQIRIKAIGPLLELKNRFYQGDNLPKEISPEEFTRGIFDFLDALDVRRTVGGWIEEVAQQKDYTAVDEHRQFYDSLVNVFDELVEVFAGQVTSAEDYFAIINSAFSQLALAFIPPTLDQVLVGSIERSRHPDLKAVFLIGATQRQFPTPVVFDSILTDDDRRAADSPDFRLAPTTNQKLAERQYLAYIAFTRPSELLYITYPAVDQDGSAIPRSQFVDELESLFEDLKEESIADQQIDIERISNRAELVDFLCSRLGRDAPTPKSSDDSQFVDLLSDICSEEGFEHLGSTVRYVVAKRRHVQRQPRFACGGRRRTRRLARPAKGARGRRHHAGRRRSLYARFPGTRARFRLRGASSRDARRAVRRAARRRDSDKPPLSSSPSDDRLSRGRGAAAHN
jgi:ATP-dependent helicase/DNAse subunit B